MSTHVLASDTTDLVSAWATAIGAGGTVVAATAAVAAGVVAIRTLRATKRDSRDRSRPMVGALLERDPHPSGRCLDLVVRSFGPSVAYGVEVWFDPPLEDTGTTSGQGSFVPLILGRYCNAIPNMMPGVELRSLWFAPGEMENGVLQNDEPIPDRVTVTIRYTDRPRETHPNATVYTDTFVLDVAAMRGEVVSTHTDDHLGLHKRTTKAMEKMAPAIEQVAKDIHRIEDYVKPDEVREREAARLAEARRAVEEMDRLRQARRAQLAAASEGEPDVESTPDAAPTPELVSEGEH
ncbi:hypothetical protein PBI_JACE_49 [Gordonia phage Jace]|uniref:Uncharacterized protein n=1 Tax=Gordonia phage Jace TaxID=2182360 RepID=A0A2U8UJ23_9CAUD|nr:hypothetical protein HOT28_gp49 [Gordonia phage Jace]AWN03669.1 hypothetical protein PBI_JACE_49 [Gordonia phage Jace]